MNANKHFSANFPPEFRAEKQWNSAFRRAYKGAETEKIPRRKARQERIRSRMREYGARPLSFQEIKAIMGK